MKLIGKAVLLGLAVATASVAACSNGPKSGSPTAQGPEENTGTIGMRLQIAPGVTISSIHYSITNTTISGFTPLSGDINVANSQVASFLIGGLPADGGFTITLTATDSQSDACSGSATFSVTAGATSAITVNLVCVHNVDGGTIQPEASTGSVGVTADASVMTIVGTQNCGIVTSLTASPTETNVGSTIGLSATVSSGSTLSWSSSDGHLDGNTSASPVFMCDVPGTFTVTATANVAGSKCSNNTLSATLTCLGFHEPGPCDLFLEENQPTFLNFTNTCSATELAVWDKVAGGSQGACLACSFNSGCLDDTAGDVGHECEDVPGASTVGSTFTSLCLATLDCDLGVNTTTDTSGPAPANPLVQNAYCGTASTTACASSQPGVCAAQLNAGFPGETPTQILGGQGDRAFPAGMANAIVACQLVNCATSCFP